MRNDIVPAPVQEKILYVFSAFFDKFEPCFGGEFRIFRAVFAEDENVKGINLRRRSFHQIFVPEGEGVAVGNDRTLNPPPFFK